MNVSETAKQRLISLLPEGFRAFSVSDFVGTCRGSTPVLQPANQPQADQQTLECQGLIFFVNRDIYTDFRDCTLDYDRSLFGKGLIATWPHRAGCACHS